MPYNRLYGPIPREGALDRPSLFRGAIRPVLKRLKGIAGDRGVTFGADLGSPSQPTIQPSIQP